MTGKMQGQFLLILAGSLLFLGCEKKENTSQQPKFTNVKDFIEYKCTMCHFTDRIFKERRKQEEWVKIVRRMRNRNRQFISAEDEQKILEYLIKEKSLPDKEADRETGKAGANED